jgi:hypothetical protein
MSIAILTGFRSTLRYRLVSSDTAISIPRADAIKLNAIGIGNYTYLTIKDRTRSEIVRYDHTADWDSADPAVVQVPVTRDAGGSGAQNFAYGACVLWEVNGLYINDYIREILAVPGEAPATSEGPALPTTMVGGRGQILGQPSGYLDLDGKSVPYYNP